MGGAARSAATSYGYQNSGIWLHENELHHHALETVSLLGVLTASLRRPLCPCLGAADTRKKKTSAGVHRPCTCVAAETLRMLKRSICLAYRIVTGIVTVQACKETAIAE